MTRSNNKEMLCVNHNSLLTFLVTIALLLICAEYTLACCVTDADLWVRKSLGDPWAKSVTLCTGETAYFKAECQVDGDTEGRVIKWEFDYDGGGTDETKCTYSGCTSGPESGGTYIKYASHTYDDAGVYVPDVKVYRDGAGCFPCFGAVMVYVLGGPIQVLDSCGDPYGKYLRLTNPVSSSPTEDFECAPDQPSGTTYKWTISSGSDNAHIEGSDTNYTVTLQADLEGDFTLQLEYIKGGGSCIATLDTAVQKADQYLSTVECGGGWGKCYPNGWMEAQRNVLYTIRDGFYRPIPHASWDETLHQEDGWPCNELEPSDGSADCQGSGTDIFWIMMPIECDNWGTLCWEYQTIMVDGWPVNDYFWDDYPELWDAGAYGCPCFFTIRLGCRPPTCLP
jgi:hypothetical protein